MCILENDEVSLAGTGKFTINIDEQVDLAYKSTTEFLAQIPGLDLYDPQT